MPRRAARELTDRAERIAAGFLQVGDRFFTEDNADASAFDMPLLWRLLFILEPALKALFHIYGLEPHRRFFLGSG